MAFLEWKSVARTYGSARALDGFSLAVDEGEIVAVLGPSGSGKSTLLRLTAGLDSPDSGRILLEGLDLAGLEPHKRGFGLMFQDYCLFPHLSVGRNIAFGLRMQGRSRVARRERVLQMLRLVQMEGFEDRDVLSLSGGEQQRVALARSLAPEPRLLMLDEPLGALDPELRTSLLAELTGIIRSVGVTALYVTHDHGEAMTAATRIALVNHGRLVQADTPSGLIQRPANPFVASFLGLGGLMPMNGSLTLVRPEAVGWTSDRGSRQIPARLISRVVRPTGTTMRVALLDAEGGGHQMEITLSPEMKEPAWEMGGVRGLWIDESRCAVFPPEA
jgi:ABC-type Fe3+/spermidine/putrescine transport system ATPase subunit